MRTTEDEIYVKPVRPHPIPGNPREPRESWLGTGWDEGEVGRGSVNLNSIAEKSAIS